MQDIGQILLQPGFPSLLPFHSWGRARMELLFRDIASLVWLACFVSGALIYLSGKGGIGMINFWDVIGFAALFFGVGWGIKFLNAKFSLIKTREELAYDHLKFLLDQSKEEIQLLKMENDNMRNDLIRLNREIGQHEGKKEE